MKISTGKAAVRLGLSAPTVRRLIESGDLPAKRYGSGRHWRIDTADIERLLAQGEGDAA